MLSFKLVFYRSLRGEALVERFLATQDADMLAKFNRFAELLQAKGPDLGMPFSRNLGKGLYELRIRGKNEVRIFYVAFYTSSQIVLLHAFKKRSQKIPDKEIELARRRQSELT